MVLPVLLFLALGIDRPLLTARVSAAQIANTATKLGAIPTLSLPTPNGNYVTCSINDTSPLNDLGQELVSMFGVTYIAPDGWDCQIQNAGGSSQGMTASYVDSWPYSPKGFLSVSSEASIGNADFNFCPYSTALSRLQDSMRGLSKSSCAGRGKIPNGEQVQYLQGNRTSPKVIFMTADPGGLVTVVSAGLGPGITMLQCTVGNSLSQICVSDGRYFAKSSGN